MRAPIEAIPLFRLPPKPSLTMEAAGRESDGSLDDPHMIVARRLSKRFGRFQAVDSVDFEIPPGEVVGFLGPNGAGKTTTLRMIAGYLLPTGGEILVDGLDLARHRRQVRQRIGYLPESAALYGEMRVREYLAFRGRLFGLARQRRRQAVDLAVKRCGLEEVRSRPIHQLSRGFRQRVGLAAALLHEPPVLILDEPTVGLDPSQILEVRSLVRELAGRHTILLSTHILSEAQQTCDRIMMMARGRIRASGTLESLQASAMEQRRYIVETDAGQADRWLRQIRGVADVASLGANGRWQRLAVRAAPGSDDLREPIFRTLAEHGAAIRELMGEAPSLEHLFVQMLAEAEADFARRQSAADGSSA